MNFMRSISFAICSSREECISGPYSFIVVFVCFFRFNIPFVEIFFSAPKFPYPLYFSLLKKPTHSTSVSVIECGNHFLQSCTLRSSLPSTIYSNGALLGTGYTKFSTKKMSTYIRIKKVIH